MKKILVFLSIMAIIVMTAAVPAFAKGNGGQGNCGANFVDEDGDGICDNRRSGNCGANFVDEDGDGICDNRKTGQTLKTGQRKFKNANRKCYLRNFGCCSQKGLCSFEK